MKKRILNAINRRDVSFLEYLHEVKVATVDQIQKNVYKDLKYFTVVERIRMIEELGLIHAVSHLQMRRTKIVCLSKKGFHQFVNNGEKRVVELRSGSILHDLALVDIRARFEKSLKLTNYITENSLQTWLNFSQDKELKSFVDVRSDGVAEFQFPKGKVYLAIEYGANQKYGFRNDQTIAKYYSRGDIPGVLFICETKDIMQRLMQAEKRYIKKEYPSCLEAKLSSDPKIFYKTISDFYSDDDLKFTNYKDQSLMLGTLRSANSPQHCGGRK